MKFKIVYKKESESIFPWPSRFRGVVLYPRVIMRPKTYNTGVIAQAELFNRRALVRLFRHELEHVYQIERMGVLRFYASYLWIILRTGYKNHPLEEEANDVEETPLTQRELKWLREGVIDLSDPEEE